MKHEFTYSGMVRCGLCGFSLVAEIKKGRYVYYHCARANKTNCKVPHVREEALDLAVRQALEALKLDDEFFGWLRQALRESHGEKEDFRQEMETRLRAEEMKLNHRLEALYADRVDSVIDTATYKRLNGTWRAQLDEIRGQLGALDRTNTAYLETGVLLVELAQAAGATYVSQTIGEKRRLVKYVLSNSTWRDGRLEVTYREPFAVLADAARKDNAAMRDGGGKVVRFDNWRASRDVLRTLFLSPGSELVGLLDAIPSFATAV